MAINEGIAMAAMAGLVDDEFPDDGYAMRDDFDDGDMTPPEGEESDDEILAMAKEEFQRVYDDEADQDNKRVLVEDQLFAQLGKQWRDEDVRNRELAGKPTHTFNKLNAIIRQVVNDARQNKPAIKVIPFDNGADPQTADIYSGLIRNIEQVSKAARAYDLGAEFAAVGGHGYWKVVIDYARKDSYDMDVLIKRVTNPCNIYPDPDSQAADSSDWNTAFEVEYYSKTRFEREFKGAAKVDWEGGGYRELVSPWKSDDGVMVASWWRRIETEKPGAIMSDGSFIGAEELAEVDESGLTLEDRLAAIGTVVERPHTFRSWKVWQYVMTGAEVLKRIPWPGQYIPIIPVYGHEYIIEGRRYYRGVIHDAKDAQQAYNFWRSTSSEMVSQAPKQPWLIHESAIDAENEEMWATANRVNHPYLIWKGTVQPQRLPMDMGKPAGAITEALSASDDIKAITGIYDASLGNRSNETSGVAINARKVEGDTSTFNFPDNVSRAIDHTGVVVIDVIPYVYSEKRILRVLGEDGTPEEMVVGEEMPIMDPETGQPQMQPMTDEAGNPVLDEATGEPMMVPMTRVLDLAAGKYDVTVQAGPSYTTRRQEAVQQLTQIYQSVPDAAPASLDLYMKATDMPMADEFAKRFKEHFNLGGPPPQVQEMQGQMEEMNGALEQAGQQMQQLQAENEQLKQKNDIEAQQAQAKTQVEVEKLAIEREKLALQREEMQLEALKLQIEQQKIAADLEKARIAAEANRPMVVQPVPGQMPMHQMPDGRMMQGAVHGVGG